MALGSTGRFYLLESEQRKKVLQFITAPCQAAKSAIIVNVSDTSFHRAVDLAEHARSSWAASMAVLPPWYAPMEQADLAEFFLELARRVPLPLSLYNYPEVTGKRIEIETIQRITQSIPLYALKQSGGEFAYHQELIEAARARGFALITGADARLPEAFKLGAAGAISGLANAVPDLLTRLWESLREGRESPPEAALLTRLGEFMKELPFPLNIKAAITARGLETGELVNPLSKGTRQKYRTLVSQLDEFFQQNGIRRV
jgi:4-hydroxy-tetrahydrodipicolinate synthase